MPRYEQYAGESMVAANRRIARRRQAGRSVRPQRMGSGRSQRGQTFPGRKPPLVKRGDVNNDGRVNAADYGATINAIGQSHSRRDVNSQYGRGAYERMDSFPGGRGQAWIGDGGVNMNDFITTKNIAYWGHKGPSGLPGGSGRSGGRANKRNRRK